MDRQGDVDAPFPPQDRQHERPGGVTAPVLAAGPAGCDLWGLETTGLQPQHKGTEWGRGGAATDQPASQLPSTMANLRLVPTTRCILHLTNPCLPDATCSANVETLREGHPRVQGERLSGAKLTGQADRRGVSHWAGSHNIENATAATLASLTLK